MSRRAKDRQIVFENTEVTDLGAGGKAIAKAEDGRVIFIEGAVPGDVADLQVTKKKSKYYEAKVIALKKLSPMRREPLCEHFGVCGGCKWQQLTYENQMVYKQKEAVNNLLHIGGITPKEIIPICGCENEFYYRNKLEFTFSSKRWLTTRELASDEILTDRDALGFHIPGMWDKVLDIRQCHLQSEPSNAIRLAVRQFAKENSMSFFDPRAKEGLLRTIVVRTSASTGEVMVMIQFFEDDKNKREALLGFIRDTFPQVSSLMYAVNRKDNDSIYDLEIRLFHGADCIWEEMEGLRFRIGPKSFYQTNSLQALHLYEITRDFAGLSGNELVYDLYTGTGTIAQFISKKAKKVIGIEAVPEAIAAAIENAKINNIQNCEFFVGDMKDIFTDQFIVAHGRPDVVVTDPPRDGMHKKVVEQLLKLMPDKIVYVSCNSATQARDLALMKDSYNIDKCQAVDMFPQTHHVENVVLLTRKDA